MNFKDLYDIADKFKKSIDPIFIDDVEITISMNGFDLEMIDIELYRMSDGRRGNFHHAEVVMATINGVRFKLIEKKEDDQ